jgi:Caspase domain
MADHALVVGCDAYPHLPGGDLRGAVADALAVREWLLSRDGGAVAETRLTFLASCSAAGAQADLASVSNPATRLAFATALKELITKPDVSEGDRLYVYLAGHGCRTDPGNPVLALDAFAFTEFSSIDPVSNLIGVQDLAARLRQSRFGVIVVILDACRNLPFDEALQLGGIGTDPKPPVNRPYVPRLFLLQSTQPGGTSAGRSDASGMVRGDFTVALVNGLNGSGDAKTYDETADRPYMVWWSALVGYLAAALPDQQPRRDGDGDDILLATFPDGFFDPVKLTVQVDSGSAALSDGLKIRVRYVDPGAAEDPVLELPGPAPVEFRVPPRRQQVLARAGEIWGRCAVDVYADIPVVVAMRPGGPENRTSIAANTVVMRDGNRTAAGAVAVRCDDPAAVIRVRDTAGHAALSGIGAVEGALAPGMYTAVMIDADGRHHLRPAEVDPSIVTRLAITAPEPPSSLMPGHEWRFLRPQLRWTSDVAVLAWAAWNEPGGVAPAAAGSDRGGFALAVAGTGPRPEREVRIWSQSGAADFPLLATAASNALWWQVILPAAARPDEPCWFVLKLAGHTVMVPGLPEAATAVSLGGDRPAVALFDGDVLDGSDAVGKLAVLDRAQSLLGATERDTAAYLLGGPGGPSEQQAGTGWVARVLWHAAAQQIPGHGLVASVAPGDAVSLLPASPWAAFVDRPWDEPPPIGEPIR